jgi:biotin transport system substrate-specific component
MLVVQEKTNTRSLILCGFFSALIAIGAFIKIPVPVVPFTLQFLFTNLAGLLLGPKLGALSVAIYIGVGLLGVPVFAEGAASAISFSQLSVTL